MIKRDIQTLNTSHLVIRSGHEPHTRHTILYAGDTSITIAYPKLVYSQNIMNYVSATKANALKPTNCQSYFKYWFSKLINYLAYKVLITVTGKNTWNIIFPKYALHALP
jgi:hypothetical protein